MCVWFLTWREKKKDKRHKKGNQWGRRKGEDGGRRMKNFKVDLQTSIYFQINK